MAEQKKDMTSLLDYAKAMQDSGQAPPPPEGSVMEEQKIDKVDQFESLEDYSKTHPAPEPSADAGGFGGDEHAAAPPPPPAPEPAASTAPSDSSMPSDDQFVTTPSSQEPVSGMEGLSGAIAGLENPSGAGAAPDASAIPGLEPPSTGFTQDLGSPNPAASVEPTFSPSGDDMSQLQPQAGTENLAPPEPEPASEAMAAPPEPEPPIDVAPPAPPPEPEPSRPHAPSGPEASRLFSSSVAPEGPDAAPTDSPPPLPAKELLRPATKSAATPKAPLEKVKQYSEQFSTARAAVPAAFPFSLLITGRLEPEERERLLDLIERENMGFRPLDLEPQLEAGRILIPRISEYAGIMILSALRTAKAKVRFGPSDEIFATADTQDSTEEELDSGERETQAYTTDPVHPAEDLPITTETHLPGHVSHAVVDIVMASAALKTMVVQAESSPEYQMLLEALSRELKYKAFRKGATAIVGFSVQLQQLHLPMHYRVLVTGSAVKTRAR